jgi:hypothetical protein
MSDSDLSDSAVEVELTGPENRGGGIYRYERYRVKLEGAMLERDAVRIGRVVVILPIDLDRDEIVLIRQFRLGAHLALGVVDSSKVPARAGAAHEQEDTRPLCVSIERALEALKAGELHYGAAVLALQWLALNRGRLREIAQAGAAQ